MADQELPEWAEGYPVGSMGYEIRRLRYESAELGATHIVDQIDAFERECYERAQAILKEAGVLK